MLDDSVPAIHIPDPFARMDAGAFRSPIVRCPHQHRRPAASAGMRSGHAGSREEALPVPSSLPRGGALRGRGGEPRPGVAEAAAQRADFLRTLPVASRTLPGSEGAMRWIPPRCGETRCHNSVIHGP